MEDQSQNISNEREGIPWPCNVEEVPAVKAIDLKAGSIIVLEIARMVSPEVKSNIRKSAKKSFPEGCEVLILENGLKLAAVLNPVTEDSHR